MANAILDTLRHNMREALSRGHLADAEDILSRLKKEDPLSRDTRGLELEFYLSANRLEEANSLAPQLCRLFPGSGRILFLAGKLEYRQKHYPEAAVLFRESGRVYPHWQAQHWLGKALTQMGEYGEAESLLNAAAEHGVHVLVDLAWLYERKNDLQAALQAYEKYLARFPGQEFAIEQSIRIRARMLEPEALIEEVASLSDLGEEASDTLFPEYVQKLFQTGQGPRAREAVTARLNKMDAKLGVRVAWVCYQAQAFDLACTLFLAFLETNLANYKYLNALESAAGKSNRLSNVLESYRGLSSQAPHLYGRMRSVGGRLRRGSPQ